MNLALKVRDEDQVTVPRKGEAITNVQPSSGVVTSSGGSKTAIDLNTADVTTLMTLPGIGEVRAQTIVTHRERNGPFSRVEDLTDVSGIGPAILESVRDLVIVR